MNKRHALFAFCIMLVTMMAQAAPITVEEAKANVRKALSVSGKAKVKGHNSLTLMHTISQGGGGSSEEAPLLYIFNVNDGQGFAVAAADDIAQPVLAYGNEGGMTQGDIPENVMAWLQGYANQIAAARSAGASKQRAAQPDMPEGKRMGQAKAMNANAKKDVYPMLTTCWDQDEPFNSQCAFDNVQCKTGCVATAMAQLLYYWATVGKDGKKYRGGCTSLLGYDENGMHVPYSESVRTFNWDKMLPNYWSWDSDADRGEGAAVAQLMRYCGQSVYMTYGERESGGGDTYVKDALFCNFHFFSNMKYVEMENIYSDKDYYSDEEWENLIYNELANGRPVFMTGGELDCHAFLCDGYDSYSDEYHFNWGWGGAYDGYYAMNALKVGGYGDGQNYDHDYSGYKAAVININPLAPEPSPYAVLSEDGTTVTLYFDSEYTARKGRLLSCAEVRVMMERDGFWEGLWNEVKKLEIDKSFANCHLTDVEWFRRYVKDVPDIIGLQYLNTDCLTSMRNMFYGSGETSLDLRSFDTSHVVDMTWMFSDCLQSVDISSFVFSETTDTELMFIDCKNLKFISIPASAMFLHDKAFRNVGGTEPCEIVAPEGFDFGVDTSGESFQWKGGRFKLLKPESFKLGDVNHDREVSVADITLMVNYLQTNNAEPFYKENADVNGDGEVTITDVGKVVEAILKK